MNRRPLLGEWLLVGAALVVATSCGAGDSGGLAERCGLHLEVEPRRATIGETITARAPLTDPTLAGRRRTWEVTRAPDATAVPFRVVGPGDEAIEVLPDRPGSYRIRGALEGRACTAEEVAQVTVPNARSAAYALRVTPPLATALPRQNVLVEIYEGTPLVHQRFSLEPGLPIERVLRGPSGGVPGTVRFVTTSRLDLIAPAAADGRLRVTLLPGERYRVVALPNLPTLAPRQIFEGLGAAVVGVDFVLAGEALVAGTLRDSSARPLADGVITLRDGASPSGVGRTDLQGGYSLRAAAGVYALEVELPGLPTLRAPSMPVRDGSRVDLAYRPFAAPLGGKVVGADGLIAAGGARVTLRSLANLPRLALLSVDGGAPFEIDGRAETTVFTGPDGLLPSVRLPAGQYEALIEPAPGGRDGVTRLPVTVDGSAVKLTLQGRRRIVGQVVGPDGRVVAGVRVTAAAVAATVGAPPVFTDGAGGFALDLDRGLAWDLWLDPPATAAGLRRAHRRLAVDGTLEARIALGAGLLLRGSVEPTAGTAIPGALVEAFCLACPDSTPIAVGISDGDGVVTLRLPDPGVP